MSENLTATRMTLLGLKKKDSVAMRGYKLLKDKQDGLMREFLKIIHEAKKLRIEIEKEMREINNTFSTTQALLPESFIVNAFSIPVQELSLNVQTKNVMSVRIPQFELKSKKNNPSYSFFQTKGSLDLVLKKFSKVLIQLLRLAEVEKSSENLSIEIQKTRQRVNALEYHLIPEIKTSMKFVKMKLDERERASIVQTMAIKAMIEKKV